MNNINDHEETVENIEFTDEENTAAQEVKPSNDFAPHGTHRCYLDKIWIKKKDGRYVLYYRFMVKGDPAYYGRIVLKKTSFWKNIGVDGKIKWVFLDQVKKDLTTFGLDLIDLNKLNDQKWLSKAYTYTIDLKTYKNPKGYEAVDIIKTYSECPEGDFISQVLPEEEEETASTNSDGLPF